MSFVFATPCNLNAMILLRPNWW